MRESIGDTFPEVSRKKLFLLLLNFLSKFLLKSTFKLKYNEIYYLPLPSASGKGYTGNSWHATITKVLSVYGSWDTIFCQLKVDEHTVSGIQKIQKQSLQVYWNWMTVFEY